MLPSAPPVAVHPASHRHHLVILFCDLCDSTRIAASIEPETYADLLQHLREMLTETIARHGGEIVRIDGDGALCIFGYPESHEDAGRRASEAAIDLHATAAALDRTFAIGGPIRLHSGIHAGVVLVREGDIVRGRFEVLGDATNIAARLCDHGGSDEIIVSDAALGADRYFFRSGPRRQIRIAGHSQAVTVFNIYGREPVTTRFGARTRRGLTPFAGRAAELARLRAWLGERRGGPMMVVGPAGIGKTRLLSEFLAEAAAGGVTVHRGYCEAYLGARPLQPFTHLAQSMTGDPAAELSGPALSARAPSTAGSGLDHEVEAMRALIARQAAAGPCILVIDDWQWADGASREMLDALLPDAGHVHILLASREPDARLAAAAAVDLVELPPLSVDETQSAIAALLPTPDPFLALRIGGESGGSPLFLEELCHASLRESGEVPSVERSALLDMLIQARFDQLPVEQAVLIRAASVIGHMVPTWLFTAMTGIAADDPLIAELAEADFLFTGEVGSTLRFKHGITRDAVYRTISLGERRALHSRVVEALKTEAQRIGEPPLLEALAYHYAASGDTVHALPYTIRAGDAALAAGALDRAQEHYRSAFEAVAARGAEGPLAAFIWPLVNKYGLACIVDPSPDQVPVMREMARRLRTLGNPEALVRSEYWIGAIAYGLGEGKQSVLHQTSALRTARELGQTRFVAQIEIKLAQSLFAAGRYAEADSLFEQVFDAVERKVARIDDESLVYAYCCHGFLHADRGDFAAAGRRYADADRVRGSTAPPLVASYLTQKSAVCLFRGEWHDAIGHARNCLEACGRTRARYQAMMSKALAAYGQWRLDRDPAAVETLLGAARWFASGASRQRTSLVDGWLAEIMAETGRVGPARHYAALAVARVRRAGDRLGEAMAYRAVARLAARQGDRRRMERYLAAAYRSAEVRGSAREEAQTRLCEAELALEAGETERAAPLLTAARAAFERMGMRYFTERAEALLAPSR
ncbi:MAG TPA: AAA family ATPase [Allosphingosinicella sp.]|jgi:class 3 adenylate cyclase/tetratricopeptide (TPR) repeat protein|nr:AAA family ATPase [Allosphingosinicella sp.]